MRNSKVILCEGINLDRDYVNVLSYTEQQMLALCEANKIAESNNFSFVHSNRNSIYTQFDYGVALHSNYIAFQNPDYSNKWFFAFVDEVIEKGEKNTEIRFTIDSWSTWFENWTPKTCFVNREHVNNDTIGLHTIPENIETGEPIVLEEHIDGGLNDYNWVGVLSSYDPIWNESFSGITIYNNLVYGKRLCLFKAFTIQDYEDLVCFIADTNKKAHIEDISDIFIIPNALIDQTTLVIHQGVYTYTDHNGNQQSVSYNYWTQPYSVDVTSYTFSKPKPYAFTDYQPVNNKALCYPYNFLMVSNNTGNQAIYKYEDFTNANNATFITELALTIGGSIRTTPTYYKNCEKYIEESLPLGKYPTCQWSSDSYTNWLTQQSVNAPGKAINALTSTIISSAVNHAMGIVTASTNIASMIGEFKEAELLPNINHGQNTGDVNFSAKDNTFSFKFMRIKKEYLEVVDSYFTRFGYKINKTKIPNITGRQNFNYVEIGASEDIGSGNVPHKYMEEINKIARKGVTIWHNHSNIGDFSVSNSIV